MRLYSERLQARIPVLAPETEAALLAHGWAGNIRELENVIHYAMLTCRDGVLRAANLRFANALQPDGRSSSADPWTTITQQLDRLYANPPEDLYARLEELIVRQGFAAAGGNQLKTARLFGMSRNTLRTLLKRFGLIGGASENELAPLHDEGYNLPVNCTPNQRGVAGA
jgi:sigma-54 dependent transcriptional regulator